MFYCIFARKCVFRSVSAAELRFYVLFLTRQCPFSLLQGEKQYLDMAHRVIYRCLMWQDACDLVQGSVIFTPSLPDIRCMIFVFSSSFIQAGLSCQEVWQIVCLDKAFTLTTNCVCVSVYLHVCCVCPLATAGVGVYPQQEHIQPMLPAWVYNDSLVPGTFIHRNVSLLTFQFNLTA